ncbi:MAG: hypothetical protein K2G31_04505, partial [Clostridia bacterium]|nr:hypothetical protein [Clostridia bacterium]
QIQQYYSETVGRTPRLNDVFFFTQTLTSGYKVFKYIYTVTGWQNYEIPGANTGSNRNLLDNSDFAINQRGIYTLLNGTGFMADRWYKAVGGDFVQVDIVGSKCTLTAKKNLTSASRCFGQAIECSDLLKGKQVTFSVNVVSPNSYAVIQMHALNANKGVISSSSQKALATTGLHSITWTVPQDCIYLQVNIVIDLPRIPINSFVTFDSPKLEPGEVVTLYTPPNIAEELSKCQRFYFDTCYDLASASAIAPYSVGAGLCFSSILAYFNIPLPTTMLQSAKQMTSIKKVDNLTVLSNGKSIPITALDVIGSNNASVTLRATGNFDVGASAILRIASGINGLGILAFDAEI